MNDGTVLKLSVLGVLLILLVAVAWTLCIGITAMYDFCESNDYEFVGTGDGMFCFDVVDGEYILHEMIRKPHSHLFGFEYVLAKELVEVET